MFLRTLIGSASGPRPAPTSIKPASSTNRTIDDAGTSTFAAGATVADGWR